MKRLLPTILLIACCVLTASADDHVTASGQEHNTVMMSNAAVHVLYRGYNNPIQVSVPGVSHESIRIECDAATVTDDAERHLWYVMPTDSTAKRLKLRVYRTTNGEKELIKEQICAITNVVKPTIVGLNKTVTRISAEGKRSSLRSKISNLKNVSAKFMSDGNIELVPGYPEEAMKSANITIDGFSVQVRQTTFDCIGNTFTVDAQNAISQLESVEKISVFNIRAKDESGNKVTVKPCMITINPRLNSTFF